MRRLSILLSLMWCLLALPAVAEPLSLQILPAQDVEGNPLPAFRDEVVILLLVRPDRAEEGRRIGEELAFQYRGEVRLAVVSVIDVSMVPSFMQGGVRSLILDKVRSAEAGLRERFRAAGERYAPPPGFVVPDWNGELTGAILRASDRPEYDLLGRSPRRLTREQRTVLQRELSQLQNHTHLLVVSAGGQTVRHFLDASELPLARTYLSTLLGPPLVSGR
jgi:hypothetical protein